MRPLNRLVALILSIIAVFALPVVLAEDQSEEMAIRTLRAKELAPPSWLRRKRPELFSSHPPSSPAPYRIRYASTQNRPWVDDVLIDEDNALRIEFLRRLLLRA